MTAPAPYEQPGAAYASPIPVRRAHLGDALASEWTKIRSVRSTVWTLGVMILLITGSALAIGVLASGVGNEGGVEEEASALGFGFFGVLLGSLCVITLGVLTIASEFGTGMIRTTLTACPTRERVLSAKAIVLFTLVFVITTLASALAGAILSGLVNAPSADAGEWLRSTVGVGAYVGLLGLLGLALGTIIRHSAGAITVMIGVMLLPLVAAMFMYSERLAGLQGWLLRYSIPSQIVALYGDLGPGGPHGWDSLWIMLGVTAVALAGAYSSLHNRDA
ncbi:ABC transporter permease subunit [Streptomyces sp. NPDC059828]|uniref:ABC transporter permease subunit n=1 Tax=Streptomyces sp. NPDC059828 TaxID=3346965 RepID=UPI0036686113